MRRSLSIAIAAATLVALEGRASADDGAPVASPPPPVATAASATTPPSAGAAAAPSDPGTSSPPRAVPDYDGRGDEPTIVSKDFLDVRPVADRVEWKGVSLMRTPGQHGSGAVLTDMGRTSGFVFRAEGEPTLYWAGDTILTDDVLDVIAAVRPDVIVTHSSGAVWGPGTLIVMDAEQTDAVCKAAPTAVVVAVHLDSLDHSTVSRADLRAYAEAEGIGPDRLRIPADGETLSNWAIG